MKHGAALAQSGHLERPGGSVLDDQGGSGSDDHFHPSRCMSLLCLCLLDLAVRVLAADDAEVSKTLAFLNRLMGTLPLQRPLSITWPSAFSKLRLVATRFAEFFRGNLA